ncbi:MAG: GxxExxY protein [Methanocella sp.]
MQQFENNPGIINNQHSVENSIPLYIEKVGAHILDLAFKIHTERGPGMLEKTYEFCLFNDLNDMGFFVRSQVHLPIVHHGHRLDDAYRVDLIVNDCVVVELKSIDGSILPVHRSQVLTYLKSGGYRLGLLINFNTKSLKDGIARIAN